MHDNIYELITFGYMVPGLLLLVVSNRLYRFTLVLAALTLSSFLLYSLIVMHDLFTGGIAILGLFSGIYEVWKNPSKRSLGITVRMAFGLSIGMVVFGGILLWSDRYLFVPLLSGIAGIIIAILRFRYEKSLS